jgi:hypothetical protein
MTILQTHPVCEHAAVIETKTFSPDQFFFKIRAELIKNHLFQVRIYYNREHIDYAYQLFTDVPLLRWDNKEEFPHLETYPHHHHNEQGYVTPSPLSGDPLSDIEAVLQEVTTFLFRQSQGVITDD